MLPPALGKALGSLLAAPVLAGGYTVGKAGELVGGGKAVDNLAFQKSIKAFLWSNGIIPTVQYEAFPAGATASSSRRHGLTRFFKATGAAPDERDMCQTPIIVANHMCYLDGVVLAAAFKCPKIVAMAGSRKVPVVGKLMQEMETIFVERSNGDSRQATLDAIKEHCSAWEPKSRPLLIFPEGTTSNGEGLLEFKKGAFISGVPVRPVILVYTGQWDPASTTYRDMGKGPQKVTDAEWAAQFLGHFVHSVHVRVLPPYIPNDAERGDPALFARNCRAYMDEAHARVHEELRRRSWKEAAGRMNGGLGYKFGDVSRTACKTAQEMCKGGARRRDCGSGHVASAAPSRIHRS
jgi:lysophosphatidylcholine acyltransferase/lyso-PAF acetyltransferase